MKLVGTPRDDKGNCEYGELYQERAGERGSMMVMTGMMMLGLVLAMGLTIDISRVYSMRTELQNAADAAALTAARELNGGDTGIDNADARAKAILNNVGFDDAPATITNVEFGVNLNGAYMGKAAAKDVAPTIRFVRVTTAINKVNLLFTARVVDALDGTEDGTHDVQANAVAGMSVGLNTICKFFPIAIARTTPTHANLKTELGNPITVNFTDAGGITASNPLIIKHNDYIVLDSDINGNGAKETKLVAAGAIDACLTIGDMVQFIKTPSANPNNGPNQMEDGTNTRFGLYPPGNSLTPDNAPPDVNVHQGITAQQYLDGSPTQTPPNYKGGAVTGAGGRRELLIPIIQAASYSSKEGKIETFGRFVIRKQVADSKAPCDKPGKTCGQMVVEFVGDGVIGSGSYNPSNPNTTSLTKAVLYR